jgi:hypothetical protein
VTAIQKLRTTACPWCGESKLGIMYDDHDTPNGARAFRSRGYEVWCHSLNDCPNITGMFPTAEEAAQCALDYCAEMQ